MASNVAYQPNPPRVDTDCAICLDTIDGPHARLQCRHRFHQTCLSKLRAFHEREQEQYGGTATTNPICPWCSRPIDITKIQPDESPALPTPEETRNAQAYRLAAEQEVELDIIELRILGGLPVTTEQFALRADAGDERRANNNTFPAVDRRHKKRAVTESEALSPETRQVFEAAATTKNTDAQRNNTIYTKGARKSQPIDCVFLTLSFVVHNNTAVFYIWVKPGERVLEVGKAWADVWLGNNVMSFSGRVAFLKLNGASLPWQTKVGDAGLRDGMTITHEAL